MENKSFLNEGGINGLGEGLVNTNSEDFKYLQRAIKEASMAQSPEQRMENQLLSIRFQMESYLDTSDEQIIHAGSFLEQLLTILKIKKKDFARYVDYEATNLTAILKGRRKINSDMALKLGRIFNINPVIWLQVESKNELKREMMKRQQSYDHYSLQGLMEIAS
ncbi:MAG: hypothetical protein AAGI23_00935 [Bacteroidota bacterium]